MPHLADMAWNFMDQFRQVDLGGGGTAHYVYDAGGQRIRKVIERLGGQRVERIYLGAVEIYRERQGNNVPYLERQTLHISDNTERIAQIDTKTKDDNNSDPANPLNTSLIRYQYSNHLGSAVLETDNDGNPITYEEYHPYGTSAYRSAKPGFDLSLKRYRFSSKERDDETGLYYFGARYYAGWLGRWTSTDPAGFSDGLNHYQYCHDNPVNIQDLNGLEGTRIYQLGPEHEQDIHTNTPEAKARLEGALTNRTVSDNGVLYQINRPALEWRGDRIGWYFNARSSDISRVGEEITFEDEVITPESPSAGTSTPSVEPPTPNEQPNTSTSTPSESSQDSGGESGDGSSSRSFFTSSFFKGLVVGLAVTVAVVAIVATGGAALAVIAPAASAAIASSATVAAVGTGLAYAGGALLVANTVQSIRQRDLLGNPISEDQANFNLGFGLGSAAGGALARPVAGAGNALGQSLGQGVNNTTQALGNLGAGGGGLALATGGTWGSGVAAAPTVVAGVSTTGAVTAAGAAMGPSVLMMSNSGGSGGGPQFRNRKPGQSGKEAATDIPSWARGELPYVGENGQQFAKRLLDAKYGPGNYPKGPGSEFNQLRKFADRAFE